jgi:hypothetical protein
MTIVNDCRECPNNTKKVYCKELHTEITKCKLTNKSTYVPPGIQISRLIFPHCPLEKIATGWGVKLEG